MADPKKVDMAALGALLGIPTLACYSIENTYTADGRIAFVDTYERPGQIGNCTCIDRYELNDKGHLTFYEYCVVDDAWSAMGSCDPQIDPFELTPVANKKAKTILAALGEDVDTEFVKTNFDTIKKVRGKIRFPQSQ